MIEKKEVLRYLGHKNQQIPQDMQRLIDEIIRLCEEISVPRYVCRVFDISVGEGGRREVLVLNTPLILLGDTAFCHLSGCKKVIVLAATLGEGFEKEKRRLDVSDKTASLIFDACANDMIEKVCNKAQEEIARELKDDKIEDAVRFSPGYGDLSLDYQRDIIRILDAQKKIGLNLSTDLVLMPQKSVTALIGIGFLEKDERTKNNCETCNKKDECSYKRR